MDSSLVRMILFLKSIWATSSKQVQPLISQMADAIRTKLLNQGKITNADTDPIVGKNISLEQGLKKLNLTVQGITPEQQAYSDLQSAGIDVSPLKSILPALFTPPVNQPATPTGTVVPTYGTTGIPTGTFPMRDYLKNVYGITDENIIWNDKAGLTVKTPTNSIFLGKPTTPEAGRLINGVWYTTPGFVDTTLSLWGVKKTTIGKALTSPVTPPVTPPTGTPVTSPRIPVNPLTMPIIPTVNYGTQTMAEFNLAMQENAGKIMNISYNKLIADIQSGENDFLTKIDKTYQDLITSSIASIEIALGKATAAMAATKGAYDEQAQIAYGEIDKDVVAAKKRSAEEMSARGIYFSGITTNAMETVEATGITSKNKVRIGLLNNKAQIDAQIATLTANTAMSESQLTNEYTAKAALDKLAYIEKDKDKIEQIKMLQADLNNKIEIDKLNLPIANEIERIQNEVRDQASAMEYIDKVWFPMYQENNKMALGQMDADQAFLNYQLNLESFYEQSAQFQQTFEFDKEKFTAESAMDYISKVWFPMLQLEYQDKWRNADDDQKFLDYTLSLNTFYENTQEFWTSLGWDKEKFDATMKWDKTKFSETLAVSKYVAATGRYVAVTGRINANTRATTAATPKATVPSWLKQYTPFMTMRADQLNSIIAGKSDTSLGYFLDPNKEEDKPVIAAITAIRDFVSTTIPGKEGTMLTAWTKLDNVFGTEGAKALIDQIDVGETPSAQLIILRTILTDYSTLNSFSNAFQAASTNDQKKYLTSLKNALGLSDKIVSDFVVNLVGFFGG